MVGVRDEFKSDATLRAFVEAVEVVAFVQRAAGQLRGKISRYSLETLTKVFVLHLIQIKGRAM
jgi:hypothetical protein